jgi:hypothetical protein
MFIGRRLPVNRIGRGLTDREKSWPWSLPMAKHNVTRRRRVREPRAVPYMRVSIPTDAGRAARWTRELSRCVPLVFADREYLYRIALPWRARRRRSDGGDGCYGNTPRSAHVGGAQTAEDDQIVCESFVRGCLSQAARQLHRHLSSPTAPRRPFLRRIPALSPSVPLLSLPPPYALSSTDSCARSTIAAPAPHPRSPSTAFHDNRPPAARLTVRAVSSSSTSHPAHARRPAVTQNFTHSQWWAFQRIREWGSVRLR